MFKVTQFLRTVSRLSEQIIRNQNKLINYKNVPKPNYIKQFYCTNSSNEIYYEKLNKDVKVDEVTKGDPELIKKLCIAILETDVLKQEGAMVPDVTFLKTHHWIELLNKQSQSARKKYLTFLFKVEKKKENAQLKKEKRREELENRPEYVDDGHLRYGLNHNTFTLRIYDSTINHLYNHNLMNAMMYGQKLIVDCSYDQHMVSREHSNCAKQLMYMFSENRLHNEPFDLHFCNAKREDPTMRILHRYIATMYEPWFPLNLHEESYLDLFPKENLVYLTPHCREELLEYDHDAIYIIGGIVDKINCEPLSLAKAKKEGIKMQKLPLDRYLQWGSGSGKSLTLNCVLNILLDISTTGDWKHALRHVPKRKISDDYQPETYKRAPRRNDDYQPKPEFYKRAPRNDYQSKPEPFYKRAPQELRGGSITRELLSQQFNQNLEDENNFEREQRPNRKRDFVKKLLKNK